MATSASAAASVLRPVAGNPADHLRRIPIDEQRYDRATRCLHRSQAGTRALAAWLDGHAGGVSWGIERCERWGPKSASLHAEGRALDWHLDASDPADRREAERLIRLFLAPDRDGNPHALARRMGVQEIIWNCKYWGTWMPTMGRYSTCWDGERRKRGVDRTTAHRDHIHFGLNWPGARLRTSFWQAAAR